MDCFLSKEYVSVEIDGFLSKEMIFCLRKWFPVKGNDFLSKEMIAVEGNHFLTKKMISCQRKWFPDKGNDFLSEEMISCQRKLFPITMNENIEYLTYPEHFPK